VRSYTRTITFRRAGSAGDTSWVVPRRVVDTIPCALASPMSDLGRTSVISEAIARAKVAATRRGALHPMPL